MSIRTILVDDEPLATQGLELRLQAHPDIEVIERCINGRLDMVFGTVIKMTQNFLMFMRRCHGTLITRSD